MIRATPQGGRTNAASRRRSALRLTALLLAGSMLAGCAVGPDYTPPGIALSSNWSNTKPVPTPPVADLRQWWHRLNDRVLNGLIEEAVQSNLNVETAKAKIREARATRRQAIGALLPLLEGSGSAYRSQVSNNTIAGEAPAATYNQFQAGFDSSWELDLFGANRRAVEAASFSVDAAHDNLRAVLLTMIGDVTAYYVEARGYQARIALARRTAVSQRETAALTQRKFDVGSASAVDVAKAIATAATTEANIPTYEISYAATVHRLGVLLGREPTALTQSLARVAPIPSPRLPLPEGIPADVLTMRPDVRQAERQLAQYTAKIGQAEAALYPSVSLTGSVSTAAFKVGDLAKKSTIGWSFGPEIGVPIFNGGQLRAAVEVSEAQRDEYYVAWRAVVLTALEDVENAIVALSKERVRIRSLEEAARRYREAARLAHALYQTGSYSFLDVLDAERTLYTAEDTLLQSRVLIATDFIALAKGLGGGWDGEIDSSVPAVADVGTGPHLAAWR